MVGFGGLGFDLAPSLFKKWPEHLFLMVKPSNKKNIIFSMTVAIIN